MVSTGTMRRPMMKEMITHPSTPTRVTPTCSSPAPASPSKNKNKIPPCPRALSILFPFPPPYQAQKSIFRLSISTKPRSFGLQDPPFVYVRPYNCVTALQIPIFLGSVPCSHCDLPFQPIAAPTCPNLKSSLPPDCRGTNLPPIPPSSLTSGRRLISCRLQRAVPAIVI